MAEAPQPQQQLQYIHAQLDKVNATLLLHQTELKEVGELTQTVERQARGIAELQKKLKVLEVYQAQNFTNNERLFNALDQEDLIEKRVFMLEQMDHLAPSSREEGARSQIQARLAVVEEELVKARHKSSAAIKFRREVSPVQDSTKDFSNEGSRNDLRKMEARMREFVTEKLEGFERHLQEINKLPATRPCTQEEELQQFSRQTRIRPKITRDFSHTTDDYYQTTERKQENREKQLRREGRFKETSKKRKSMDKRDREKMKSKEKKMKSRDKKMKSRDKKMKSRDKNMKSQSSSKTPRSDRKKGGRSTDKLNLVSVNQYLRLREYMDA